MWVGTGVQDEPGDREAVGETGRYAATTGLLPGRWQPLATGLYDMQQELDISVHA